MKNNYKIWIILSLVIVFIAGGICGVLFEEYILGRKGWDSSGRQRPPHFPTLEIMAEELNLTPTQQNTIKGLFNSNEERFRALRKEIHKSLSSIRSQMIADIKGVLTEAQNKKFEAMIEKYEARIRREHEERKKRAERSCPERGEKK
jgi:Spy/CpxP family protein refolding chaperone